MDLVKFEKIDPPGTFCTYYGIWDLLKDVPHTSTSRFLEIGCGEGGYSEFLLKKGLQGTAVDSSVKALEVAKKRLAPYLVSKKISLKNINFFDIDPEEEKFDIIMSVMVLEHVENEKSFIDKACTLLKPDGRLILVVPAKMDAWGVEDDLAGHLRRYDRNQLPDLLKRSKFEVISAISIGYPFINVLLRISNMLIKKYDSGKTQLTQEQKTSSSGSREIPFKTVFPKFFKLILNEVTLTPLKLFQRLFYQSDKGLVLAVSAKRSSVE